MSRLWYQQPAKIWEEALPIGNGRLGAMVFGEITSEHLQVNEESMWYGGEVDRINPNFKENLPLIREYLHQGLISKAEKLMDRAMSGCPDGMHPYQTLGDLSFCFEGISGEVTGYERSLSLEDAVARTAFTVGETVYTREVFASHPGDAIVIHFAAKGPEKVNFSVRMRRGTNFDGVKQLGKQGISLYGNLGRGGYEFAMALTVHSCDGDCRVIGECLEVAGASEVTLLFTADTTYHYTGAELDASLDQYLAEHGEEEKNHPSGSEYFRRERLMQQGCQAFLEEKILDRFRAAEKESYRSMVRAHVSDYRSLYDRFVFELDGIEGCDQLPTDVRLQNAKAGSCDVGLGKLLFDFGRYLTISCSRPGGLPATLQGIWNKDFNPPWDCKYTININAQMNYWHVESCGLGDCHEPLFDLIGKVQVNGRRVAKEMYGCRGFVAHHNTDIHGDSAPQDIWYPGTYWTMGAAWLCTHLWMHYEYTLDRAFLKKAFPILAESALFFVDFLIERDGYLVTSPSVSPENTYRLPNGESGSCCEGPTMDNQILRHLFTGCLEAYRELGAEAEDCHVEGVEKVSELMEQISECMSRLHPTKISDSGRIMEWPEDFEEAEPGHRHISHLYGLYPAGEITMDGTPELAAAARKTLEYRLAHGGGHTGWSRAWIMNHYAALWDGETAYANIEKMLGQSTYPNMFDMHPPFQIDGNFGAAAAMCGMLAQSNRERIVLLPALPNAWKNGRVKGLCLVGNMKLSMEWRDGKLTTAVLTAGSDINTQLCYAGEKQKIQMKAGEEKVFSWEGR